MNCLESIRKQLLMKSKNHSGKKHWRSIPIRAEIQISSRRSRTHMRYLVTKTKERSTTDMARRVFNQAQEVVPGTAQIYSKPCLVDKEAARNNAVHRKARAYNMLWKSHWRTYSRVKHLSLPLIVIGSVGSVMALEERKAQSWLAQAVREEAWRLRWCSLAQVCTRNPPAHATTAVVQGNQSMKQKSAKNAMANELWKRRRSWHVRLIRERLMPKSTHSMASQMHILIKRLAMSC